MIQILMWAKWAGKSSEWAALDLVFWQFSKRTKKSRLWSAACFNHSGIPSTFEQNWSLEKNARWYKIGLWYVMKQQIYFISNEFIRCFHQFFQRIFLSLSSWKRKLISYWSKQGFFLSLPVEKEIITKIRRFGIRDWSNYLMNSLITLKKYYA